MFSSSKPYSAVTQYVERLTDQSYNEDDFSGIVDLIEVIQVQSTGPTEAARALRKKLKYGDTHRQLRALTIMDGLLENGGDRFQRSFADEPLLERLRIMPRDETADPVVREKCNILFRQWASRYSGKPGMTGIAALYKDLPKRSRPTASQSKVIQENERDLDNGNPFADATDEEEPPAQQTRRKSSITQGLSLSSASSSSRRPSYVASQYMTSSTPKKDKKSKRKAFNLEREKPNIMQAIASANVASTNLLNALKFVNRETTRVSDSPDVMNRFEACKLLRRQILQYIQLIESDQWIGSLINANDELVKALMAFEVMDKSVDDDSDSEAEGHSHGHGPTPAAPSSHSHARATSRVEADLVGLNFAETTPPAKPPRPGPATPAAPVLPPPVLSNSAQKRNDVQDEDDDDPFGDEHEI